MNWRSLTFRFRPRRHGQPAQRRRSIYFRFHSRAHARVQLIIKLSGVKIVVLSRSFCTRRLEPSTIYSSPGAAYRLLIAWSRLPSTHRLEPSTVYSSPELSTIYPSPGAFYCVLIVWSCLSSTPRLKPFTVYSSPGAVQLSYHWSCLLPAISGFLLQLSLLTSHYPWSHPLLISNLRILYYWISLLLEQSVLLKKVSSLSFLILILKFTVFTLHCRWCIQIM